MQSLKAQKRDAFSFTSTDEESVELLRCRVLAAIANGRKTFTSDIDQLSSLSTHETRTLIELQRFVRRIGGHVSLRVTRSHLLRALHVCGLDKVFDIE
jgi:anti-anti-sigma regulatory factor